MVPGSHYKIPCLVLMGYPVDHRMSYQEATSLQDVLAVGKAA